MYFLNITFLSTLVPFIYTYSKSTDRISRPIRRTVIFSLEILEKNNDDSILILVIYWKTGLLHTKISNHNIIYSSYKPTKSLSLPQNHLHGCFHFLHIKCYLTYPQCIRLRSNLSHIFREKKCVLWAGKYSTFMLHMKDVLKWLCCHIRYIVTQHCSVR
jgi:hypothetical protein